MSRVSKHRTDDTANRKVTRQTRRSRDKLPEEALWEHNKTVLHQPSSQHNRHCSQKHHRHSTEWTPQQADSHKEDQLHKVLESNTGGEQSHHTEKYQW